MKFHIVRILFIASAVFLSAGDAFAWGRGGGVAAGGGYHANYAAGGYRGADYGGAHTYDYGGARTYDYGGYRGAEYRGAEVGGYRGAEVGGYHGAEVGGYHAGTVGVEGSHAAVTTDFGFGHVAGVDAARGYVTPGHYTTPYTSGALAADGAAVRGGYYRYGAGAFDSGWWTAHPGAWRPFGWDDAYAWNWATPLALGAWFGWTAAPVYYDYGGNIVYQGDQVYVNGQPGPTAAVYYQQAADLALAAPAAPTPDKKDDWQPLGVFGLVQGGQSDASAVFQLAVNKAGTIRGNYTNILTGTTLPVRGSVDPKTQRASWIVGDQKTTVYDTGIYNLTKDQSPLLIHFGKDRTQEWVLVRIQQKDAAAPPAPNDVSPRESATNDGTARVSVMVPADAELFFEGAMTTQTGTLRTFTTPPLDKGYSYQYTIRARWTQNGMPVEQTRKVPVKAGANVRVDFTSPLP